MDVRARVTAKGQVTIPKAVRDQLALSPGDDVVFRLDGARAMLAKTPDLLDLAGTVDVPAGRRDVAWDEIRRQTRRARAEATGR